MHLACIVGISCKITLLSWFLCALQHLDKTPNQYIQWRYATGEDREGVDSVFRKATEEEEKKKAAAIKAPDGTKKVPSLSIEKARRLQLSKIVALVLCHHYFFKISNLTDLQTSRILHSQEEEYFTPVLSNHNVLSNFHILPLFLVAL